MNPNVFVSEEREELCGRWLQGGAVRDRVFPIDDPRLCPSNEASVGLPREEDEAGVGLPREEDEAGGCR